MTNVEIFLDNQLKYSEALINGDEKWLKHMLKEIAEHLSLSQNPIGSN